MDDTRCLGCNLFMPGAGRYKYDRGLCRDCYQEIIKGKRKQEIPPDKIREVDGVEHWGKGVTMCLYCHEQTRTIRAISLHRHMTNHDKLYDALSESEKEKKHQERMEKLARDTWVGDVRKNYF